MLKLRTKARGRRLALPGLAGVVAVVGMLFAPTVAHADTLPSHFTWTATAGNINGDLTEINNGATNGQPGALLYVTPNYSPGGVCGCVTDNAPIAVDYDTGSSQWTIFNEDDSAMPVGAQFNVFVEPAASTHAFRAVSTTSNDGNGTLLLNSSATNDLPGATLQVTQVWSGAFNDHPAAVDYTPSSNQWQIFNEPTSSSSAPMVLGTTYNVLVGSIGGGKASTVKATASNAGGNSVHVNNAIANGDSNAFVLDTPNFDPQGACGCVHDSSQTGVWYFQSDNGIAVFNESDANMLKKTDFDLLVWNS